MLLRMIAILAAVILIAGGAGVAQAANIDGRVTGHDGYGAATEAEVYLDNASAPMSGAPAQLYMAWTTGGDLDVALVLPAEKLVDTTYAPTKKADSLHSTWANKLHNFMKLKTSDAAPIKITDASGSTILLDVVMDYLYEGTGGWEAGINGPDGATGKGADSFEKSSSSMVFNLEDPAVNWGDRSDGGTVRSPVLDSSGGRTSYSSSEASAWVYEVVYEFRINSGLFSGISDPSSLQILFGEGDTFHVSNSKTDQDKIYIPPTKLPPNTTTVPASAVPLPSGAWMGLMVLGCLGVIRRYRLRRQ